MTVSDAIGSAIARPSNAGRSSNVGRSVDWSLDIHANGSFILTGAAPASKAA
ncbi:hypothetical protein HYG81_13315 [Natrinema zhouii]|uniref:Uncharacterized protein n=1 Tax=Natrinema zhouii TaxID=1710539 RepID=A0A7D6CML0_9EURY|nr:hypothetical protein [Natrinema zhouii]QLK25078.1 hypothetical protein HYG81_13315 [Natrinema zhouii]